MIQKVDLVNFLLFCPFSNYIKIFLVYFDCFNYIRQIGTRLNWFCHVDLDFDKKFVLDSSMKIWFEYNLFQILSPIRIAMIGGLHRTAAACHLFSGITPTPNSTLSLPKINKQSNAVNITKNMVINATTALTILVPKTPSYNDNYINQTAAYSYRVDKRKTINLLPTF